MKKLLNVLVLVLLAAFALNLTACKKDNGDDDNENNKPSTSIYEDFKIGLTVPGKLLPKRIRGGVLLVDTNYQMR